MRAAKSNFWIRRKYWPERVLGLCPSHSMGRVRRAHGGCGPKPHVRGLRYDSDTLLERGDDGEAVVDPGPALLGAGGSHLDFDLALFARREDDAVLVLD